MTGQGELQYLWCRVEEEGDRVNRVDVMHPNGEMWASTGHPISPDKLAFAVGAAGERVQRSRYAMG